MENSSYRMDERRLVQMLMRTMSDGDRFGNHGNGTAGAQHNMELLEENIDYPWSHNFVPSQGIALLECGWLLAIS